MTKTATDIRKRLSGYKNGTVDSPYRITKVTSREPGYLPMQPGAIDVDKRFNAQCMDLIIDYVLWFTDNQIRMWGNARDAVDNNLEPYFTWHDNTPSYVPPVGAIGVATFGTPGYEKYGHIWIVNGKANVNTVQVLEQNWNNLANLPPKLRTDNYFGCEGFWVPNTVKKKTAKTAKKVAKAEAKKSVKMKTLKYNRDQVTGYKLPKRGYKPKGIVLHNDAGRSSAMQYHDSLVNASYARLTLGIAHSYISGNTVWQALPEGRIAWHTGESYGNTNLYGIEICQSMSATDKEFLENEQTAFQEAARMLKKWKLPVDRTTVRLHNEFSPTECPHRSMKLHAGYSSSQRAPQSVINKTKDYFISQIKQYYDGKIPKGSTVIKTPTKNTTPVSDWNINEYGTWYKPEAATFVNGGQPIITRTVGPFRTCPQSGVLQPNVIIQYDEVMLQDGHVWLGYNGYYGRVYLPIRTWDGIAPPNQGLGFLWGTIQ